MVEYVYDAWGNHEVYDGEGNRIETDIEHIGNLNPIRYRGYYYDAETDLYYLQTRYYDPATCRFVNADDVTYADAETLQGLNLYAYCGNNPIMRIDPTGHMPKWLKWMFVGALAVAAVAAIAVGTVVTGGGLLIGAGVGVLAGGAIGGGIAAATGNDIAGGILLGGAIGGIAGAFAGVGLSGAVGGMAAGGSSMAFAGSAAMAAVSISDAALLAAAAGVVGATGLTVLMARTSRSNGYWGEKWPGDHDPNHIHLKGEDGTNIRIGEDGLPLKGESSLNSQQRKALKKLWSEIMRKLFRL